MRDWLQLPLSAEANPEHPEEEISLWAIVLAIFGLKKIETQQQPRRQIQSYTSPQEPCDEMICNGVEMIDDDEEEDENEDMLDETEYTPLQRTMSCSSIASSIASETSTAASSHADEVTRVTTKELEITPSRTVQICWNHGGKKVQLTGEFDNWTVSVDMIKDKDDRYYANLPVSQSKDIEYKFVVDGQWCFADDLPHRADWHGNINNVLYREEASYQ
ncbi:carbohydrate-binding module family 48 protein [Backusella circina FSU 941]|nr:carbohydrate-binding module family 48 protein [Backusella circina FSU 941]